MPISSWLFPFPLRIQSRTPVHGRVLPTSRADLNDHLPSYPLWEDLTGAPKGVLDIALDVS